MMADPEWQVYLKKLNEFGPVWWTEHVAHDPGEVLPDQAVKTRDILRAITGLSRRFRLGGRRASLSGIAGSSPAMTTVL